MFRFLLMLIFCATTQRILGKTLFDYNINPQYDLVADESTSYSNFWPSSDFYVAPVGRHKHHAKNGNGKRGRGPSIHGAYPYSDSSEEYHDSDEYHGYPLHPQPPQHHHHHHPHGLPPGQAKKQNQFHSHPHPEPPRRFPPPPVYDPHFINPWILPAPAPAPTPLPFTVQQPPLTTPGVYIAPKLTTRRTTTTPAPPLPAAPTSDDQLIYDIDVRFGRE